MKVLRHQSNYLSRKAKRNRNIGLFLYALGGGFLLISFLTLKANPAFPILAFVLSLLAFGMWLDFFGNASSYSRGSEGENLVTRFLSSLNDGYFLINDVRFPDGYGNIDHIVLGPNGIFVVGSKNYSGVIRCDGDEWARYYPDAFYRRYFEVRSPSRQVKRNAVRIKQAIESAGILRSSDIWVEGIVAFTDPDADLQITNPTVSVLRIDELCEYIATKQSRMGFASKELKSIAYAILNRSEV